MPRFPVGELEGAKEIAAAALASGKSQEQAARIAKVGTRTVRRWIAEDARFRLRVAELRAGIIDQALGGIVDALAEAVISLRRLLGAESEQVRLGACRSMFELTLKLREHTELEERLSALEKKLCS